MRFLKIYEDFGNLDISYEEIDALCHEFGINGGGFIFYNINSDGTVDVDGEVDLYSWTYKLRGFNGPWSNGSRNLDKLPIRFGKVGGDFHCNVNELTTLEGSPKYVGGDFDCSANKLTSFVGGPEIVKGNFIYAYNNITSFEGFPKSVGGYLHCIDNPIWWVWKLFKDTTKIELFNEFDPIRGRDIILDRLNDFLVTIGKEPVESIKGYNNI